MAVTRIRARAKKHDDPDYEQSQYCEKKDVSALTMHSYAVNLCAVPLLLRRALTFQPMRLFDTVIAARLIGVREFSYAALVEKYFGIGLAKGSQKANWALRPLSPKMEEYARNDTHYLLPLAEKLEHEERAVQCALRARDIAHLAADQQLAAVGWSMAMPQIRRPIAGFVQAYLDLRVGHRVQVTTPSAAAQFGTPS